MTNVRALVSAVSAAIFAVGFTAGNAAAATLTTGDGGLLESGDTLQIRHGVNGVDSAGVDLDITLIDYAIETATWTFVATVVGGGLGGDDLQGLGITKIDECNFAPNVNCLDTVGTIVDGNVTVTPPVIGGFTAQAIFAFDPGGDGLLNVGETSDRFFLSYGVPLVANTGSPPEGLFNFMINPAAVGVGDQNVQYSSLNVAPIPEPSAVGLYSAGITTVGLLIRRRRRRTNER